MCLYPAGETCDIFFYSKLLSEYFDYPFFSHIFDVSNLDFYTRNKTNYLMESTDIQLKVIKCFILRISSDISWIIIGPLERLIKTS